MFRPADIVIDAFVERLAAEYTETFPEGCPSHRQTITQVARMSLARIASSNALYHDLEHTILTTQVAQDMLHGRIVRDGDVTSEAWVHFVSSALCFAIGFVRDACPGDDEHSCVVDEAGTRLRLPPGATDGVLWPVFADRSKIFIRHYFRDHPVLNWQMMAGNVEYARFPAPPSNDETGSYPGLLRAAQIVGSVADPNFMLKLRPLLIEVNEAKMVEQFGFSDVAEFKVGYPTYFWKVLRPLIVDGVELLSYTGEGRTWLSNMHTHVLIKEHRVAPAAEAEA